MLCPAGRRAKLCLICCASHGPAVLVSHYLFGVSNGESTRGPETAWSGDMTTIAPLGGVTASGTVGVSFGAVEPGAAAQQSFQDALHRSVTKLPMEPEHAVDQLGSKVMEWMESSYERVQRNAAPELNLMPEPAASGPASSNIGGTALGADKPDAGRQALQMLEHAFSFAIEATLMSKISTESTRIFNTFLKGQ